MMLLFCVMGSLSLRSHQEAFDGITSLAMYLYPMFSAYIIFAFTTDKIFCSLRALLEPNSALKIIQNRMRNIHVQRKTIFYNILTRLCI